MKMQPPLQQFLDRALPRLQGEHRLLGVAVRDHWAKENLENYSDLDLVCVADSGRFVSLLGEADDILRSLSPHLSVFPQDGSGGSARFTGFYEDPLLCVDFEFLSSDDFTRRSENPVVLFEREGQLTRIIEETKPVLVKADLQWMEDRFWAWIHSGAQKLERGELFALLGTLASLRSQVLGPLLALKAGRTPQGVGKLEQIASAEDCRELSATVATYAPRSAEAALRSAAKLYVDLRETLAPPALERNRRAEMAAMRYLHEVSSKF